MKGNSKFPNKSYPLLRWKRGLDMCLMWTKSCPWNSMPELLACSHCHGSHFPVLPVTSLHSAPAYPCLHLSYSLYSCPYHCSPAQNPTAYKVKHRCPILQTTPALSNPTHSPRFSQPHWKPHMCDYAAHKPSWCLSHIAFSPFLIKSHQ